MCVCVCVYMSVGKQQCDRNVFKMTVFVSLKISSLAFTHSARQSASHSVSVVFVTESVEEVCT